MQEAKLAGEPITAKLTRAPGNNAPIGGLKVVTASGWFAARPSGTENIYKIYAESFQRPGAPGRDRQRGPGNCEQCTRRKVAGTLRVPSAGPRHAEHRLLPCGRRHNKQRNTMDILVVDVGGTHVKILATGQEERREFDSGPTLSPEEMVSQVKQLAADWKWDAVSIGYPGPVLRGRPSPSRAILTGWVGFDFAAAFGCPVKIINDAAMQALGSFQGGKLLFLGLGTGLGSTMIVDGIIEPMELAHLPYRKRTFEDYVGIRGLKRLGKKKWRKCVDDVVERLWPPWSRTTSCSAAATPSLKELPPVAASARIPTPSREAFRLWKPNRPHLRNRCGRSGRRRPVGQ